jgi:glycosyltransferase involved in cell wall biosynthesis
MPAVSVIIPAYKHAHFIEETLASVLNQTYSDFEVIVINDGSPDNTAEVLRPYVESGRIRYFEQPNSGQSMARNRGIQEAIGEYIALLDDDDIWPQDKLEYQVNEANKYPNAVVIYGKCISFTENGDSIPDTLEPDKAPQGDVLRILQSGNFITSIGQTLIKASALKKIQGFDPDLWGVDDWDLYIRLAAEGEYRYKHHLALNYRVHAANAMRHILKMYQNAIKMRNKHFGEVPSASNKELWSSMGNWSRDTFARVGTERFLSALGNPNKNKQDKQEMIRILWQLFLIDAKNRNHLYLFVELLKTFGIRKPRFLRKNS